MFACFEKRRSVGFGIAAIIVAALVALIYIYDFVELSSLVDDSDFITVKPGAGLYLGTAGSIAAVVGLVLRLREVRSQIPHA